MAAESYHKYKNNGLWIEDSHLEIFLHFLLDVWRESYTSQFWLDAKRNFYELNSQGLFPDMMSVELDELLLSTERITIYKSLLEDTAICIERHYPEISLEILDQIREMKPMLPKQSKPLPIKHLLEVKDAILQLIEKS